MINKTATTATDIDPLLAKRWSPHAFDSTKDISSTQLLALMEAARWAPSCYGDQPWYYLVFHKSTHLKAFKKAFSCLVPFNQDWVAHVPLLFLATARKAFHHNGEPNRWAEYDTGAASENICLQATSMGLMARQMAGFDAQKATDIFEIPETHTCIAMIAVGYQCKVAPLPKALQETAKNPRARNPIHQHFFNGTWGEGMDF